jgi:uncharacterized membrane protein
MLGLFKKKPVNYFSEEEKQSIVGAIQQAELRTSGEIRIYIESKCDGNDPVKQAEKLFHELKMNETAARNGVMIYLAMQDRKLAIFGDEGIHQKVGNEFWNREVEKILSHFNKENFTTGITEMIHTVGEALHTHFPYDAGSDENELPDDIVFGN